MSATHTCTWTKTLLKLLVFLKCSSEISQYNDLEMRVRASSRLTSNVSGRGVATRVPLVVVMALFYVTSLTLTPDSHTVARYTAVGRTNNTLSSSCGVVGRKVRSKLSSRRDLISRVYLVLQFYKIRQNNKTWGF